MHPSDDLPLDGTSLIDDPASARQCSYRQDLGQGWIDCAKSRKNPPRLRRAPTSTEALQSSSALGGKRPLQMITASQSGSSISTSLPFSYCTVKPSLVPRPELRDKIHVPPEERREGLPEKSRWNGRNVNDGGSCGGDKRGSCVSTKGVGRVARACGEAGVSWSWVCVLSMSVTKVC
jgi:hypothetical protein